MYINKVYEYIFISYIMKHSLLEVYMKKFFQLLIVFFALLLSLPSGLMAEGMLIPTDSTQKDFLKAYKLILTYSNSDYRFLNKTIDTTLFPAYGEYSPYWIRSGNNKGSFVFPDEIPSAFASVSSNKYTNYRWQNDDNYSIQYKPNNYKIAIFRSKITRNNNTVSWGALYFKNMFDSYLFDNIYYFVNEDDLAKGNINSSTQLLIIPSFTLDGDDNKHYIDSVFEICPDIKKRLDNYLQTGGSIYSEGNAVYFIEKLGYLPNGAVDFDNSVLPDPVTNLIEINYENSTNPLSFMQSTVGGFLFANACPAVNAVNAEIVAKCADNDVPSVFVLSGINAGGGKIICNTGIPTIGGINELKNGSRQLQWALNTVIYSFSEQLDVTRSVYNELPDTLSAGKNAVSFDRLDTFEVRILLRNLSSEPISDIKLMEILRRVSIDGKYECFLKIVDVKTPGITYKINDYYITFENISVAPHSETVIVYRLSTPNPEDKIHEQVDKFISWATYMYASVNYTYYNDSYGKHFFQKYRNYIDIMFSAFLAADTDLNWKNFLGLFYQPFKVFMNMENKERTEARQTKYVQYIPKDVPFYWSDKSINIPILKTPGGKFVDVLRGSNSDKTPDYDYDSDGKPNVWLDTASIYPKGYKIEEDEVYWLNPWEHLRTGNHFLYEDIDHDGKVAEDTDGDGIVNTQEPGDKIKVWKVTWDIGKVSGFEYFEPYCSYEIWVDPPDLVKLSAGVGYVSGKCKKIDGCFYPNSPDIENPNIADTSWTYWMERDEKGMVIWKQLIYQRINNYEGYTFIDTAKTGYKLKPTDICVGTVPQPHREFIAVLSLGGEEIDMNRYRPQISRYSNLEYNTIFGEHRKTPIRSTYSYWAPLPNPLQFEYLSNNFVITDPISQDTLKKLPKWGKANISFSMDASTEYSYYWIRNAGHDVDYNDPSEAIEGREELGDGVFGYLVYDIPKGLGGYKIHLPKKIDGSYDIDAIVEVDGGKFKKWLDNPNTKDTISIWEDPFQYHIHIPQLLIPPALDDDNHDGIDDWIDDRGDRFCSSTGFLHDIFMLDNGEQWLHYPKERFKDDIYGWVDSGWYAGPDLTYGDDYFEALGKTNFKINAIYEGLGREGNVEISKGGWLVVEEIFGGSPWVIFSRTLSGFAEGVDLSIYSKANPSVVKFGSDTMYIKHQISDKSEPHRFDYKFDPFHSSYGYGKATITTYAGGRDPCSLLLPSIKTSTIIDPKFDKYDLTLIPYADKNNPELEDYPKQVSGCFLEARVEVTNATDDNWLFTTVTPKIPSDLGKTELVMSYVAYPRPLVPAKVDPVTGVIIQGGDDIGSFRAGWRFNEPEGEVLVKIGNKLPLMQPTRKAYFVFLFRIDSTLDNGVYEIGFDVASNLKNYKEGKMMKKEGVLGKTVGFEAPPLMFSISQRDKKGNVTEFQKFIIGNATLDKITTKTTEFFRGLQDARWSFTDVNNTDFYKLSNKLPAKYNEETGVETIDVSSFGRFPTITNNQFFVLEQGEVFSYEAGDLVTVSNREALTYDYPPYGKFFIDTNEIKVTTVGPKIKDYKAIFSINGKKIEKDKPLEWPLVNDKNVEIIFEVTNYGNNLAENTVLNIYPGTYFVANQDILPPNTIVDNKIIKTSFGSLVPGETKQIRLNYKAVEDVCSAIYDESTLIPKVDISYKGSRGSGGTTELFAYTNKNALSAPAHDLRVDKLIVASKELKPGDICKVKAKLMNGDLPSVNSEIFFYAIYNMQDTVFLEKVLVDSLASLQTQDISINYIVADSVNYIEILAYANPDNKINEFCTSNNINHVAIPLKPPNWILDVSNNPNPMSYTTQFSYFLPNNIKNLKIEIFSLEGVKVATIYDCPVATGRHYIQWKAPNSPDGVYIYRFSGTEENGNQREYNSSLIRNYR